MIIATIIDVCDQILDSVMCCNSSGSISSTNGSWDQTTSVLEQLLKRCVQRGLFKLSYFTKMYMYVGNGKFNNNDLLLYIAR